MVAQPRQDAAFLRAILRSGLPGAALHRMEGLAAAARAKLQLRRKADTAQAPSDRRRHSSNARRQRHAFARQECRRSATRRRARPARHTAAPATIDSASCQRAPGTRSSAARATGPGAAPEARPPKAAADPGCEPRAQYRRAALRAAPRALRSAGSAPRGPWRSRIRARTAASRAVSAVRMAAWWCDARRHCHVPARAHRLGQHR